MRDCIGAYRVLVGKPEGMRQLGRHRMKGQRQAPAALYPRERQEVGWSPGLVWTGAENLAPTGIRSPDRPARSQSLYPDALPSPYRLVKALCQNTASRWGEFCNMWFWFVHSTRCELIDKIYQPEDGNWAETCSSKLMVKYIKYRNVFLLR